jgi:TRAP-type C4-dicarboxylate transport system permease small subunit
MTPISVKRSNLVIRRIIVGIDHGAAMLVIIAMAGMVAVISTQVFLRYALNSSLSWAEEVSRLFFVWAVFLAIPLGVKRGAHVGVDLLISTLPNAARSGLFRLTNVLGILLMCIVAWQAGILVRNQWDEPMTTLDISVGLFMAPLLVGSLHSIVHLLLAAIDGPPARNATTE